MMFNSTPIQLMGTQSKLHYFFDKDIFCCKF